ncbi:hypothetical protein [Flavobacterium sp.]|uniref:hypothetical protein n=1 Tax=Flavobacterium sp. TaxID=239 RepID=UPI0031E3B5AB
MNGKQITVFQIIQAMETQLFNPLIDPEPYWQREELLKRNIGRCLESIRENIDAYNLTYELDHWEKYAVERNLKNFEAYLSKLHSLLNKNSIEIFVQHQDAKRAWHSKMEEDEMVFMLNSFYTTIKYDILWAGNISVSDVLKLSRDEVDFDNLIRKFPEMINTFRETVIPFFESITSYVNRAETLKEAINTFEHGHYKAASSLVLIELEGLVRQLGAFLIEKQNIDKTKLKKKYHSLDSFLKDIPWLEDFVIDEDHLMFLSGDFVFKENREFERTTKISLKTRLNFLRRRFKENRNSILHGDAVFGETWDLYVNFSAMLEVYSTIKYYENLYGV